MFWLVVLQLCNFTRCSNFDLAFCELVNLIPRVSPFHIPGSRQEPWEQGYELVKRQHYSYLPITKKI